MYLRPGISPWPRTRRASTSRSSSSTNTMPPSPVMNAFAVCRLVVETSPRASVGPVAVGRSERLRAVDHELEAMAVADRLERAVVDRRAAVVGDEQGGRAHGGRLDRRGVDVERGGVDVAEDRGRAAQHDRADGRDVGERGHEHAVAGADACETKRDVERDRPVRDGDPAPPPGECGELRFETLHLGAHRDAPLAQERGNGLDLLVPDVWLGPGNPAHAVRLAARAVRDGRSISAAMPSRMPATRRGSGPGRRSPGAPRAHRRPGAWSRPKRPAGRRRADAPRRAPPPR